MTDIQSNHRTFVSFVQGVNENSHLFQMIEQILTVDSSFVSMLIFIICDLINRSGSHNSLFDFVERFLPSMDLFIDVVVGCDDLWLPSSSFDNTFWFSRSSSNLLHWLRKTL